MYTKQSRIVSAARSHRMQVPFLSRHASRWPVGYSYPLQSGSAVIVQVHYLPGSWFLHASRTGIRFLCSLPF
jgi:hypothetical protein